MILLIQAALGAMVILVNYLVIGVFGGPWWLGFILTIFSLCMAWFSYLIYQAKHPDWWPPWDEGLPKEMRMINAFVPIFIIYVLCLIMLPVFERAKRNRERRQKQQAPAVVIPKRSHNK